MDTLQSITGEFMYNHFKTNYPTIVEGINALLSKGETPDKIHKFFQKKLGKQSATAAHIGIVADYLSTLKK